MIGTMRVGVFRFPRGQARSQGRIEESRAAGRGLFLGDYSWDAAVLIDEGIPACVVRGNNDFGSDAPDDATLSLGGVSVYCTHGHKYGVSYSLDRLYRKARGAGRRNRPFRPYPPAAFGQYRRRDPAQSRFGGLSQGEFRPHICPAGDQKRRGFPKNRVCLQINFYVHSMFTFC